MSVDSLVAKQAPLFTADALVNGSISKLNLSDYKGSTFVCPTEVIAFSDRHSEFKKLNCEVIGISVDSVYTHNAWANTPRKEGGLSPISIPLVSDLNKAISRAYGVLHDNSVALRGLFIIDDKGVIRQATVNDLPIGRSVDETIRLIEAVQFFEKHGEVCPANWRPGQPTIKASPEESKKFFQASN